MSYILDALKKSEHERQQGRTPGLQTVHLPVAMESSTSRWPYIIIALLMLSLAFVLGMLRTWDASIETMSHPVVKKNEFKENPVKPAANTRQELVAITKPSQQVQNQPEIPALMQPLEPLKIESSQIFKTPSPEMDAVPHLYDMPSLIQQAIPDMSFSGHVYSSDVNQRSVIINGHSTSEGEVIIEGLKIEQITRKGVIFNFQGQLFRMEILQDWSFD